MEYAAIFFFFILGTVIGSFLNVVVLRLGSGMSMNGRSECFSCTYRLQWFDLVPVASFLVLRGRCRRCKTKISYQYPLVELLAGIVFALSYVQFGFTLLLLFTLLAWSILTAALVYDIRHTILPDTLVWPFVILSFIFALVEHASAGGSLLWTLFSGPLIALPLFLIWLITRGRGMGFGDVKLSLGMGWLVGIVGGINALIFSFWIGAVVSLLIIGIQRVRGVMHSGSLKEEGKGLTMKSEIPFGPFLVAGLALVYFFNVSVLPF